MRQREPETKNLQDMFKIEKLTLKNLSDFFEVFKEVLKTGFPEYSSQLVKFFIGKDCCEKVFVKKIKGDEWFVLVAKLNDKIIGFLVAENLYGGVSYAPWEGVIEELQRQGVGSKLIKSWEQEIKKIGGHKLALITQSQKNRQFFLKCGFKEEGFEEKSWFGLDCWKFGKVIGKPKPEVFLK